MNKRLLITVIFSCASILLLAGATFAQKAGDLSFAFGLGPSVPTNARANEDFYAAGLSAHAKVAYPLNKAAQAEINLIYSRNGLDEDNFYYNNLSGDPMTIMGASGGVKIFLSPDRDTSPYLFEGFGVNWINQPELVSNGTVVGEKITDSPISLFFGCGMEMKISRKMSMYFDVLYSIGYRNSENFEYIMFRTGVNLLRLIRGR